MNWGICSFSFILYVLKEVLSFKVKVECLLKGVVLDIVYGNNMNLSICILKI